MRERRCGCLSAEGTRYRQQRSSPTPESCGTESTAAAQASSQSAWERVFRPDGDARGDRRRLPPLEHRLGVEPNGGLIEFGLAVDVSPSQETGRFRSGVLRRRQPGISCTTAIG